MGSQTFDIAIAGHCPSEQELQEILRDMEDPQEMGYINVDRFYPAMTKIMMQEKYTLLPSKELLKAFKALDTDDKVKSLAAQK